MAGRSFFHQLDAKNRMRIPAKLREEIGENYSITIGSGGCLYVYTKVQMDKIKKAFENINPFREDQLASARYFIANTLDVEEDKQGRFILTEELRKYAKIEKNVVVFKGPSCIEIWSEESWNEYFNKMDFSSLASVFENVKND